MYKFLIINIFFNNKNTLYNNNGNILIFLRSYTWIIQLKKIGIW